MGNGPDPLFLRRAIALATENVEQAKGGPFGAVVVSDGQIVGEGANSVTTTNDPTAHAEVNAIRAAARTLGRFALQGCTLYTSCEPCPMCLGAAYWARVDAIYFGANAADAARAGFDDAFLYAELCGRTWTHASYRSNKCSAKKPNPALRPGWRRRKRSRTSLLIPLSWNSTKQRAGLIKSKVRMTEMAQSAADESSRTVRESGSRGEPVIRVEGLKKTYKTALGELNLFAGLNLTVETGEMLAVVGQSGAGKSTLLHILGALDTPSEGRVYCASTNVTDLNPRQAAEFRNREIGYVWQFHYLLPEFSAQENVAMPLLARGLNKAEAMGMAANWLREVDLEDRSTTGRVSFRAANSSAWQRLAHW